MGVLREITERTLKDKEDLRERVEEKRTKVNVGLLGWGVGRGPAEGNLRMGKGVIKEKQQKQSK